jgi:hypothetical protein
LKADSTLTTFCNPSELDRIGPATQPNAEGISMSITMQGAWTLSVKTKNAAFAQRFIVSGASTGNGTYAGELATSPVFVSGTAWSVTIQNRPAKTWVDSADQITFPSASGGLVRMDIQSNDAGTDRDFDDLVLTCSTPQSSSEFIVYGNASTYAGPCWFNPCALPWIVIETPAALTEALRNPISRAALERLYPERLSRVGPLPPPPPEPFAAPLFKPMVLPLRDATALPPQVLQSYHLQDAPAQIGRKAASAATASEALTKIALPLRAQALAVANLRAFEIDRSSLAGLIDKARIRCDTQPLPGSVLRFAQYDRSEAELGGAPYAGNGTRNPLGLCATDRNGNYVFRFTWSNTQAVNEALGDTAGGENALTQLLPDVMAQFGNPTSLARPCYESAPYWNIGNLRRINLCIPRSCVGRVPTACQGNNAIQSLGNIAVGGVRAGYVAPFGAPPGYGPRVGLGNTLGATGRITARNPLLNVPQARCAAWGGLIDLFGCFLDLPQVTYYTVRTRRHQLPFLGWNFVTERLTHAKIANLGIPGYTGDLVGPLSGVSLAIDGAPAAPAPAYLNIESDAAWVLHARDLKIILSTWLYAPVPGPIDVRLEGYDAAGNKVAAADDTVTLFVDNSVPEYFVQSVSVLGAAVTPCSLVKLATGQERAPVTVRFKAEQDQGFMQQYAMNLSRCTSGLTVQRISGGELSGSYTHGDDLVCSDLTGTPDDVTADGAGIVSVVLEPAAGQNWLGAGETFGIYTAAANCSVRRTNGYNTAIDNFGPSGITFALTL